ncbi:hypothetical protein [Halovulum sp. GXIMD14793]
MPAAATTKAAIKRAIDAVTEAGLVPSAIVVGKDGTIRVEAGDKPLDQPGASGTKLRPPKWGE